jgi:hypothetical protein
MNYSTGLTGTTYRCKSNYRIKRTIKEGILYTLITF